MGVNVVIQLPDRARLGDVATVIGIAAGLPYRYESLRDSATYYVSVDEIKTSSSSMPECARITWGKGDNLKHVLYHFEGEDGGRELSPPSTPFWCAVGVKLVTLFGGSFRYSDSKSQSDLVVPTNPLCGASGGEEWEAWQQAMMAVKPITDEDLKEAAKFAAYSGKE